MRELPFNEIVKVNGAAGFSFVDTLESACSGAFIGYFYSLFVSKNIYPVYTGLAVGAVYPFIELSATKLDNYFGLEASQ